MHSAVRKKSGAACAVKVVKANSKVTEEEVRAEADLMRQLDHPNIIRTIDLYWASATKREEAWIVSDLAAGGELFSCAHPEEARWRRGRGSA